MYFSPDGLARKFPFVKLAGIFVNYPILLTPLLLLTSRCRNALKCNVAASGSADETEPTGPVSGIGLASFAACLVVMAAVVMLVDLRWAPFYIYRYSMDTCFLLAIASFIALASWLEGCPESTRARWGFVAAVALFGTCITCVLLFFVPNDFNLTASYPEVLENARRLFTLDLG